MFRRCLHIPKNSPSPLQKNILLRNNASFQMNSVLRLLRSFHCVLEELLWVIILWVELSLLKWRQYFCTKGRNKLLAT